MRRADAKHQRRALGRVVKGGFWKAGIVLMTLGVAATSRAQTQYDFGSPTAEEQYLIELVNRTRVNPTAEAQMYRDVADPAKIAAAALNWDVKDAYSYYGVDLAQMQSQYAALPPVGPLAPNAKLMTMSRSHTSWMFTNKIERHAELSTETDTASILRRFAAAGYPLKSGGENIYAYARSLLHAHVGFEVDWGTGTYGMQTPAYHRLTNHSSTYREIGVGVKEGLTGYTWDDVGPFLGTYDIGVQSGTPPSFVTGVAYFDANGNQRYDLGEGIGGVRVDVSNSGYYAITAPGGGYAVPVAATAGTYSVSFSGLNASHTASVTVPAGQNAKLDYVPTYIPPTPAVGTPFYTGTPVTVTLPAAVGASAIDWITATKTAATPFDCNTPTGVTYAVVPTASYPLVTTANSRTVWHLAHPQAETQWVQLAPLYLPGPNGSLTFQSRLAAADQRQVARVQISSDEGTTWTDAWNKVGGTAASSFAPVNVSLAGQAGMPLRVRFCYTVTGDSWINSTGSGSGWFIDDVAFTDVSQLTTVTSGRAIPTGSVASFNFSTNSAATYIFAARPVIGGRNWPSAVATEKAAVAPSGFVAWAQSLEQTLSLTPGSVVNFPDDDPLGLNIPGLVRYALGIASAADATSRLPVTSTEGNSLVFTYKCDPSRTDVTIHIELSNNFATWVPAGSSGAPASVEESIVSTAGNVQTRRVKVTAATGGAIAARLKCTR